MMLIFVNSEAIGEEVQCEKIEVDEYGSKTCFMDGNTSINSSGFRISTDRDETIEKLKFSENNKIKYLPENIHEAFPKLTKIYAIHGNIKEISSSNFENLLSLGKIDLSENLFF